MIMTHDETTFNPSDEDLCWASQHFNVDRDADTVDYPGDFALEPVDDDAARETVRRIEEREKYTLPAEDFMPARAYEGKVSALLLGEGFPRALLGAVLLHLATWGTAEGCDLLSPIEAAWVEHMLPMAPEAAWLAHDGYRWEA